MGTDPPGGKSLHFEPVTWLQVELSASVVKEWARDYYLTLAVEVADLADAEPFDICLGDYKWAATETSLAGWVLLEGGTTDVRFTLLPMANIEERLYALRGRLPVVSLPQGRDSREGYDTPEGRALELQALTLLYNAISD